MQKISCVFFRFPRETDTVFLAPFYEANRPLIIPSWDHWNTNGIQELTRTEYKQVELTLTGQINCKLSRPASFSRETVSASENNVEKKNWSELNSLFFAALHTQTINDLLSVGGRTTCSLAFRRKCSSCTLSSLSLFSFLCKQFNIRCLILFFYRNVLKSKSEKSSGHYKLLIRILRIKIFLLSRNPMFSRDFNRDAFS